jgi:dipeptidyl aminopeptidase/acylaminoacyl peptidase
LLGGAPAKLRDNMNAFFTMAPDDRRVAFVRQDDATRTRSLIISSLGGANETVLATLPTERNLNARSVAWSPDGSVIAVSASRDSNDPNETIFLVQPANGELRPLAPSWRDISRVVWLKDGSGLLIIAAGIDPHDTSQVWFVAYPRGEVHRITNDPAIYDIGLSVAWTRRVFLLVQRRQITTLIGPTDDSKAKQLTLRV